MSRRKSHRNVCVFTIVALRCGYNRNRAIEFNEVRVLLNDGTKRLDGRDAFFRVFDGGRDGWRSLPSTGFRPRCVYIRFSAKVRVEFQLRNLKNFRLSR